MGQVSCRAFAFLRRVAQEGGVSIEALLTELPAQPHWEAPDAWVSWPQWVTLVERVVARLGRDDAGLVACGAAAFRSEYTQTLGPPGALGPDARMLLELRARWLGPALFVGLHFSQGFDPGGARLRVRLELGPGLTPCRSWLLLFEGVLTVLPAVAGLPPEEVERVGLDGRRGEWLVPLGPPGAPLVPVTVVDALLREQATLAQAQEQLRAATADVERAAEGASGAGDAGAGAVLDALPPLVLRFRADTSLREVYGGQGLADLPRIKAARGRRLEDMQREWGVYDTVRARTLREVLEATLRTGAQTVRYADAPTSTGALQSLLLRGQPHEGDVLVVCEDRTEELAQERRLQHAERMASLGELAAGVAHEVNNPLTTVMASVPLLRRQLARTGADAEGMALLDELEAACLRIAETTGRMRAFSEVSPPMRRVVQVAGWVERAVRLTGAELRYRATLALDLQRGLQVWGDAGELDQVLVNLLTHAAQAMPPGASPESHHVWVRARGDARAAVLEVTHDGGALAPEALGRLFDPYFGAQGRRGASQGLGLSIAHRVITAHGGRVEARSAGGQTTLVVRLPLAPVGAEQEEPTPLRLSRRGRVLVVDDDPSVTLIIQRTLARHEVTVLADGREAFERLRAGELPDLVLCDLLMPGCTGMELHAALQRSRPEALERVAFMSSGAFMAPAREFLATPALCVLPKPFPPGLLQEYLHRALATGRVSAHGGLRAAPPRPWPLS